MGRTRQFGHQLAKRVGYFGSIGIAEVFLGFFENDGIQQPRFAIVEFDHHEILLVKTEWCLQTKETHAGR